MDQLFEIARKTFHTPEFRGITFIESEAKSIINRVPGGALPFDWTINPYRGCSHACVFCFARPTHTYLDMDAGRDFETKIVVKVNALDVLRRELAAKRWKGEHIAMGTPIGPRMLARRWAHGARAPPHPDDSTTAVIAQAIKLRGGLVNSRVFVRSGRLAFAFANTSAT